MAVVLAVDAGTTGVRAVAVDEHGRVAGSAYREMTQHFPRPGWVEHDPVEIWQSVQATLGQVVATQRQAVAALGVANQRETVVAWDRRSGRPLHPAIVWQDRRTAARCAQLAEAGHQDLVRSRTGLVLDPYFSATKAEWMLGEGGVEAGPDLALGTVDSWILWNLTGGPDRGVFATDASNASRTMLFDIGERRWSEELCALFGVPLSALAQVVPSSGRTGSTSGGAVPGLAPGTPVSGLAGDQAAALFGQACVRAGMAKNTYGTGSFVLANIGPAPGPPVEGLLTSVAWDLSGAPAAARPQSARSARSARSAHSARSASPDVAYALEGSIFSTGSAIQWLRDGLGIIDQAAEIGPLAASVETSDGVVVVPAFSGLGSPWWDPWARGAIVGLSRGTGRGQVARAVLEAMAHQTRDVVDHMAAATGSKIEGLRVDGGASVLDLMLQIQADQLGVAVARPQITETTALGAAFLAGLAEEVWGCLDDIEASWRLDAELLPAISRAGADARHAHWHRALDRARAWALEA